MTNDEAKELLGITPELKDYDLDLIYTNLSSEIKKQISSTPFPVIKESLNIQLTSVEQAYSMLKKEKDIRIEGIEFAADPDELKNAWLKLGFPGNISPEDAEFKFLTQREQLKAALSTNNPRIKELAMADLNELERAFRTVKSFLMVIKRNKELEDEKKKLEIEVFTRSEKLFNRKIEDFYKIAIEGIREFSSGNYKEAEYHFNAALNIFPSDPLVHFLIKECTEKPKLILNMRNKLEAEKEVTVRNLIENFRKGEQNRLQEFYVNSARGTEALKNNDYDTALVYFNKAKDLFPDDINISYFISECESEIEKIYKQKIEAEIKVKEEREKLKKEILGNRKEFDDLCRNALRFYHAGNFPDALNLFLKARSIFPDDYNVNYLIEESEKQIKLFSEVLGKNSVRNAPSEPVSTGVMPAYPAVQKSEPGLPDVKGLIKEEKFSEALDLIDKLLAGNTGDEAELRNLMSEAKEKLYNKLKEEVLVPQLSPEQKQANDYMAEGNYAMALEFFRIALKKDPDNEYLKVLIRECESKTGSRSDQTQVSLLPDDPDNLRESADALFNEGKYFEALEKYKSALSKMPNDPYLIFCIEECENILKIKFEKTREELPKSFSSGSGTREAMPENIADLRKKADELFEKGKYNEAAYYYQRLLESDPNDLTVKLLLDECKLNLGPKFKIYDTNKN